MAVSIDRAFYNGYVRHTDCDCCEHAAVVIASLEQDIAMLKATYEPGHRRDVSPAEADAIRAAIESGLSMRAVAKRFGIKSPSTVHRIVRGNSE